MARNPYEYILDIKEKKNTEAQLALQKALIALNQRKEIYNISTKELCDQAHVARSTFYAYYDNIAQLQEECENKLICGLIQINDEIRGYSISQEDFSYHMNTCKFMSEHKQAFHAFLIAYPNMQFVGKWKDGIKYHFWECLFRDRQSENNGFILELIAAEAITAFTYWFQNPYDVDMRVLNSLITKILELLK